MADHEIGTRGEFFCFYLVSLVFGLIGFLISLCIASTHAARLGSRAGFSSGLLFSGVYMLFANYARVDQETATTMIAVGAFFAFVGLLGLSLMRAWRRVMRAYIAGRRGIAVTSRCKQRPEGLLP